jgi:hypothetical protein
MGPLSAISDFKVAHMPLDILIRTVEGYVCLFSHVLYLGTEVVFGITEITECVTA